ncbi:hypothetical protein MMC11_004232 [Xylographa trunciseda]|nr:hypothetical protein [Xylographa trunciseda]
MSPMSDEEMPAEITPAKEPPVGELPAEDTLAKEIIAEKPLAEKLPAEGTPAVELPAVELPAGDLPAGELRVEETPANETPAKETPAEETSVEETPAKETPAEEIPAEETPAVETPEERTPEEEELWDTTETNIYEAFIKYLQQIPNHSATEAAQNLNALYPPNRTDEGKNEPPALFLRQMWDILIQMVRQIPFNHDSQDTIIDVIMALSELPIAGTITVWAIEFRLWKDLPLLGHAMAEEYESEYPSHRPPSSPPFDLTTLPTSGEDEEREEWLNINAFAARLAVRGIRSNVPYALFALRAALEDQPDRRASSYQRQGPVLDCHVPAAVEWIMRCGDTLFACEQEFARKMAVGGRLWKGKQGYCPERWLLWKLRFGEVGDGAWGSERTRALAKVAEMRMEEIEAKARARKAKAMGIEEEEGEEERGVQLRDAPSSSSRSGSWSSLSLSLSLSFQTLDYSASI